MRLYSYFRSSAAYRVRIVLTLKGLEVDYRYIHMLKDGGQQRAPAYAAINPMKLVPALEVEDDLLTQSLAICEYLDETCPDPPLLPGNAGDRAYVREIATAIACEIHPLNNLRVLAYLSGELGLDKPARDVWYRHWIAEGLTGVEALVARSGKAGDYCFGDAPTLADAFLVPQLYNARRFNCDLSAYPLLTAIDQRATQLPAFAAAAPEAQGDVEA
ncbi:MAG: glutathione-S-transferase [Bradyrhizobium sp.]|nr:glutathione-S-transferase [Bradyrhizobium sp.]